MRGTTSLPAEHIPSNDSCELRLADALAQESLVGSLTMAVLGARRTSVER